MTTKEKMQILLDGGKLKCSSWNFLVYIFLNKDGDIEDEAGGKFPASILNDVDQIYTEPEDETLYEWAYETSTGTIWVNDRVMTKKQAHKHYNQDIVVRYYMMGKFEPLETFGK